VTYREGVAKPSKRSLLVDDSFLLAPDTAADAAAHRRFALDADAARFLGWTTAEAESAPDSHYNEVVSQRIAEWSDGTRYCFMIRTRADDEPVGTVELRITGHAGDVSYFVVPEYRGIGLATKALDRLLAWATKELELAEVFLECSTENAASRRVAVKSGFALVARVGNKLRFHRGL
jgi:ribosomal-protein-alanine N-acetyltransferase